MVAMNKIPAIVMTYDRNRVFTNHMIVRYRKIWSDHPFRFHIPYQSLRGKNSEYQKFVKTSKDIKQTVLTLLEEFDDEEWIYWCIDDKYPISLNIAVYQQTIDSLTNSFIDGILLCRCRRLIESKNVISGDNTLNTIPIVERRNWHQIWIHQFIRVKVLRHLFHGFDKPIAYAKQMDEMKWSVPKLPEHKLFVSQENFSQFGESTVGGLLTQNCMESLRLENLDIPREYGIHEANIIMGEL